jgi:hypothetical protein
MIQARDPRPALDGFAAENHGLDAGALAGSIGRDHAAVRACRSPVPVTRIYRGIVNPAAPDRVEVVQFTDPGTYLVICGILPHLVEGMYGWVKVIS